MFRQNKRLTTPGCGGRSGGSCSDSRGVAGNPRAVRRERDLPSALLPTLAPAPPDLSSSPVSLPAQFGAAGVTQNPWFQPCDDPVVLPAVTGRQSPKTGAEKASVEV